MRRFFGKVDNQIVKFSKASLDHIKVLRLNYLEQIEVCDDGNVYLCEVSNLKPFEVRIIEKKDSSLSRELTKNIILFCPLLKRDNFELVLQKATELGVKEIYPYISSRVIKRVTKEEFNLKIDRYNSILLNASEQSNRDFVPKLHELNSLEKLAKLYQNCQNKYIAYEQKAMLGNKITIVDSNENDYVVLFGPEGGFSLQEVELFKTNNFKLVSLGKRILRAETACFYLLSVLAYLIE